MIVVYIAYMQYITFRRQLWWLLYTMIVSCLAWFSSCFWRSMCLLTPSLVMNAMRKGLNVPKTFNEMFLFNSCVMGYEVSCLVQRWVGIGCDSDHREPTNHKSTNIHVNKIHPWGVESTWPNILEIGSSTRPGSSVLATRQGRKR